MAGVFHRRVSKVSWTEVQPKTLTNLTIFFDVISSVPLESTVGCGWCSVSKSSSRRIMQTNNVICASVTFFLKLASYARCEWNSNTRVLPLL